MNQTTHFTQWKNLTDEQKAGFDFEGYKYQVQGEDCCFYEVNNPTGLDGLVYRLKIEPEKWYFCEVETIPNCRPENTIKLGEHLSSPFIIACHIVRPATAAEIPEPETLEDRIKAEYSGFDVVMLRWVTMDPVDILKIYSLGHFAAQSMKGFYKYVYIGNDDSFCILSTPIGHGSAQPIAVLFSRGAE